MSTGGVLGLSGCTNEDEQISTVIFIYDAQMYFCAEAAEGMLTFF